MRDFISRVAYKLHMYNLSGWLSPRMFCWMLACEITDIINDKRK